MELHIPSTVIPGLQLFHRRPNLHKFGVTAGGCTVVARIRPKTNWTSSNNAINNVQYFAKKVLDDPAIHYRLQRKDKGEVQILPSGWGALPYM
jgi:hypothetical protein